MHDSCICSIILGELYSCRECNEDYCVKCVHTLKLSEDKLATHDGGFVSLYSCISNAQTILLKICELLAKSTSASEGLDKDSGLVGDVSALIMHVAEIVFGKIDSVEKIRMKLNGLSILIWLFKLFIHNDSVCEAGLSLIKNVCRYGEGPTTANNKNIDLCVEFNLLSVLMNCVETHKANDHIVAESCLALAYILASSNLVTDVHRGTNEFIYVGICIYTYIYIYIFIYFYFCFFDLSKTFLYLLCCFIIYRCVD